ncbi:unnamed protein product [Gongylonema pulchrum]|uniref:PrgI family protein n=1 Tax=Gongylonema pulchrum TaxID=637853 RepID=A0A183DRU6_9BILA|nr:unnamed protein product [Gongylonema pulchrum]
MINSQYFQAEQELALQNVLFEHQRAVQLADSRALIASEYLAAFLAVSLMLLSQKTKKPYIFAIPAVPIFVGLLHNFDQQRDITMDYIKEKAEQLRRKNRHLFKPIGGPITLAELDRRIEQAKHQEMKAVQQKPRTG